MQVRTAWMQCIPLSCFSGLVEWSDDIARQEFKLHATITPQNEIFYCAVKGTQVVCVANLNPF